MPSTRSTLALCLVALAMISWSSPAAAETPAPIPVTTIKPIATTSGKTATDRLAVGLGGEITVELNGTDTIEPTKWHLFLDGRDVTGDKDGAPARLADGTRALIFPLALAVDNRQAWAALLGAPTGLVRDVTLSVGQVKDGTVTRLMLPAEDKTQIHLVLTSYGRAAFTVVVIVLLTWLAVLARTHARYGAMFRDRLLPQIKPEWQPYSLGRLQMAFWSVLVFISFVALLAYLGDANTITPQALTLMGISGATGLGAILANGTANDDLKAAIAALNEEGLGSPQAVEALRARIAAANGAPTQADDKAWRTWLKYAPPYMTKGLVTDILNDENGAALHRLQVVVWTLGLGAVFVWDVWSTLAMPEFSNTQLALIAVSGGSYVGFKIVEKA